MGLPTVGAIAEVQNLAGFNRAISQVNKGLSSAGSASQGLASASSATGAAMSTLAGVGMAAVTAAAAAVTAAVGATVAGLGALVTVGIRTNSQMEQLEVTLQTLSRRELERGDIITRTVNATRQATEADTARMAELTNEINRQAVDVQVLAERYAAWAASGTKTEAQLAQLNFRIQDEQGELAKLQGELAALQGLEGKVFTQQLQERVKRTDVSMEEVQEQARSLIEWVRQLSVTTPFTVETLANTLKQAMAYGFTSEEAKGLATTIGDVSAALGGGAETMDRIIRALGQMRSRTKVAASEMLQLTEAGIPAWEILAEKMGVSVGELQDMVSKGVVPADEAIKALTESMQEDFGGAMEAQSKTAKGLFDSLKEIISLTAADITAPIFERLRSSLEGVVNILTSEETLQALNNLSGFIGTLFEGGGPSPFAGMGQQIQDTINAFGMFFGMLELGIDPLRAFQVLFTNLFGAETGNRITENVIKPILEIFDTIKGLVSGRISVIDLLPPELGETAQQFGDSFRRIGEALGLIDTGGLGEGIGAFLKTLGEFVASQILPFIVEQLNVFADWLTVNAPLISEFLAVIGEQFGKLGPQLQDMWSIAGPILATLIQGILGLVTVLMEIVTGDWDAAWRQFLATVIQAGLNLSTALSNFADIIAQALGAESFAAVLEVWAANWEAIRLILFTVWENIKTTILQAFVIILAFLLEQFAAIEAIWEKWTTFRDRVVDVFNGIVLAIIGAMTTAFETVSGRITDIIAHIQTRKAEFIEQGRQMIEGFIKGILSRADRLVAVVVELMANARQAALDVLGIGSPSKVFAAMGENVDTSFANAIQRFSGAPIAAAAAMAGGSAIAANQAVSAIPPASPVTVQGGNTTNASTFAPVINTQTTPESPTSIVDELVLLQMLESA